MNERLFFYGYVLKKKPTSVFIYLFCILWNTVIIMKKFSNAIQFYQSGTVSMLTAIPTFGNLNGLFNLINFQLKLNSPRVYYTYILTFLTKV